MLRGSRPGERRGGRTRGTPNRRTILRDRILSIGLDDPAASQHAFLLKLVQDRKLPADTRIAVAPNCFPAKRTSRAGRPRALASRRTGIAKAQEALGIEGAAVAAAGAQRPTAIPAMRDWTPQALDALFGVVQDAGAGPRVRSKAALKIAGYLLPKMGAKPKIIPDEYGFAINPSLASAYRDMQFELRALVNGPWCKIPANAEKIKKLEARSDAIRRRLQAPCPSKYANETASKDWARLVEFMSLRDNGTALTEEQKAVEAHLRARFDVFAAGPESIARRRRAALQEAERKFKKRRFFGEFNPPAPPLSRQHRSTLKLLRWLYPEPAPTSPLDEFEMYRDHPFKDELPAPDGNFYPRDSKLRPGAPNEEAEKAHLEPGEARIYELEERRAVGAQLTASDEEELRDLRKRYPEYAAAMDLMDLQYLYHWRNEFEIARKAGLDIDGIYKQAEDCCLRIRDESKFIHEWQARRYLLERRGKAAEAAGREP